MNFLHYLCGTVFTLAFSVRSPLISCVRTKITILCRMFENFMNDILSDTCFPSVSAVSVTVKPMNYLIADKPWMLYCVY